MSVSATVTVTVAATQTKDVTGAGTASTVSLPFAFTKALASGTAINQADRVYAKRRTVTGPGTADSIDLAGALTDAYGDAVVFAEVVGIFIKNNATVAGQKLLVGGDTNAVASWVGAANDVVKVAPGGVFALLNPEADAYAVTASTGDILKIDVSAGTNVSYDILILGKSA